MFRQVGYRVARVNADAQYQAARVQPNATLAEHLDEFEDLWRWMEQQWLSELTAVEQHHFAALPTNLDQDLFRILGNFARAAIIKGQDDFPFPIKHVADRIGVSFQ